MTARRLPILLAIGSAASVAVALVASGAGTGLDGLHSAAVPSPRSDHQASESDAVGGFGKTYRGEPRRVTGGEYSSAFASSEALERAWAQLSPVADPFVGTILGVRIAPAPEFDRCPEGVEQISASESVKYLPADPSWMPADTVQVQEDWGAFCGAKPYWPERLYEVGQHRSGVGIMAMYREFGIWVTKESESVREGLLAGEAAIFIDPRTVEGYSTSVIAFWDDERLIIVTGQKMPMSELERIATSLREDLR